MAGSRVSARPQAPSRTAGATDDTAARIVDAALACFTQYGISKTTVEDVAVQAGCSRATLYRYFPGKQAVIDGVVNAEIDRIAAGLDDRLVDAGSLEDVLVEALVHVGEEFEGHEALGRILEIEPEIVLPHVAFDGAERVFTRSGTVLAPHLTRFLPADTARRAGEWVARVALTYLFCPSEHVSLTDPTSVRYLVRTFVLPGIDPTTGPTRRRR